MDRHHSFHLKQSKYLDMGHIAGIFHNTISETEIIAVNDLLLSSGFHTITVKNIASGRHILETFLTLLNCYQRIYWLTIDGTPPTGIIDLYDVLKNRDCLTRSSLECYQDYLYQDFYADFLVVECTERLLKEPWYADFEQALYETHLFDQMPVVQLLYADYQ